MATDLLRLLSFCFSSSDCAAPTVVGELTVIGDSCRSASAVTWSLLLFTFLCAAALVVSMSSSGLGVSSAPAG